MPSCKQCPSFKECHNFKEMGWWIVYSIQNEIAKRPERHKENVFLALWKHSTKQN